MLIDNAAAIVYRACITSSTQKRMLFPSKLQLKGSPTASTMAGAAWTTSVRTAARAVLNSKRWMLPLLPSSRLFDASAVWPYRKEWQRELRQYQPVPLLRQIP